MSYDYPPHWDEPEVNVLLSVNTEYLVDDLLESQEFRDKLESLLDCIADDKKTDWFIDYLADEMYKKQNNTRLKLFYPSLT
jgi:hypothetical protein